ncbi:hypothetical protein [Nannocystis bainbridge]|uniref:Lipoprotein n=1 Tax=Nannocystis bainbridge TaxID=2995303 RepID=A0ABT5E492_9BACT|nr:hypothetical protein [Nannocystis bainbridge]MDC0719582.1 hypothetical protein [Nannocystis bainbridge]
MRPSSSPQVLLGVALVSIVATGCSGWVGYGNTYYKRRETSVAHEATYSFGNPGSAWRPLSQKGTQVAWYNDGLDAVIVLDSQCEMHGDSSLEQFTDHLRIDFREWEVLSQDKVSLVQRDAVHTVVIASIDGVVKTQMEIYVVKKDGCLFDLEYLAPPRSFESGRGDFAKVVKDFTFPTRGG